MQVLISDLAQSGRHVDIIQCTPCGGKPHKMWVYCVQHSTARTAALDLIYIQHSCSGVLLSCDFLYSFVSLQKWHVVTSLYYWMDQLLMPSIGKGKMKKLSKYFRNCVSGRIKSYLLFVCLFVFCLAACLAVLNWTVWALAGWIMSTSRWWPTWRGLLCKMM